MNKKQLLFVVAFCITTCLLYAQNELSKSESNFKGGFRLGFTASQISGDNLGGYNKLGGYAGGFVNFPLTKDLRWMFQFEINFMMKGSSTFAKLSPDGLPEDSYVLTLFYTESPFLVRWKVFKGIVLELGPALNFLCYEEERINGNTEVGRQPFRFYEIAIIAGASYFFKAHWGINFRWSSSILPVRVPNFVYNRSVKKQFNDSLALSLYYQF